QSRPLLLFHDPPTTAIYALSLHDALPISFSKQPDCFFRGPRLLLRHHSGPGTVAKLPQRIQDLLAIQLGFAFAEAGDAQELGQRDRKSTRLNSSHGSISYAVFCLKKKKHT